MAKPGRKSRSDSASESNPSAQRINKYLAAAGLGSRRDVEELIVQGRVEIDGEVVTNLATRVDPAVAKIKVDGVQLKPSKLVYYALNKPKGVLSTNEDPTGRTRVIDLVPDKHRVFSVGRLDLYSEGLMLLTNDGDLAQRLAHPRYRVQKTYFVVVAGVLTKEELAKLRKGVYLAEGMARIDGAQIRKTRKTYTELEILLSEGKNREIRRILARAGHKVMLLRRIAIGPLRLAELPVGAARELTAAEIKGLYACTQASRKAAKTSKAAKDEDSVAAKPKPKVTEKIVTPIENEEFDDFGLGLEQDYQYDESQLVPSDDAIEFGGGEEDWDDDFGGDFPSMSTGSVLAYDEDDAESNVQDEPSSGPRRGRPAADRDRGGRDGRRRESSDGASRPRRAPAGGPGGAKRRSFRADSDGNGDGERSERPRRPSGRSGFGGRSGFSSGSSDRRPAGRPRSDRSSGYASRDRADSQAESGEEPRRGSGPRGPRPAGGGPRGGSRFGGGSSGPRPGGGSGQRRSNFSDRTREDFGSESGEEPRRGGAPRGPRPAGGGPRGGSRFGGGSRGPRPGGGSGQRRSNFSDRTREDFGSESGEEPRRGSGPRGPRPAGGGPRGGSRFGGGSRGPRPGGGSGQRRSDFSDRTRDDSGGEGHEGPRRSHGPRGPRPGSGGPRGGSGPGGSSGPRGSGRPSGGRPSSGGGPRGGSRPGGSGPRGGGRPSGGRPGGGGGRPSSGPRGGGRPGGGSRGGGNRGGGRPGGR